MGFEPGENEKVTRKCETDGETQSVWPIIDDGISLTFAAIRDQETR